MSSKNPVGWFEIYVQDLPRAGKFYETVLQIKLEKIESPTRDTEMLTFPMHKDAAMGCTGALVKMQGVSSGGNSTLVYFMSEDCSIEAGRVAKAGGKVFKEKMPIGPHGFIALAVDTEGNMFGIHSMK